MKNRVYISLLLSLFLCGFVTNVQAADITSKTIEGIDVEYWISGGSTCYVDRVDKNAMGTCTIPETVDSYTVTGIGYEAFKDCSGLTSIIIPISVTWISKGAFDGTPWYDNQPDGLLYVGSVAYKYIGTMPEETSIDIKEGTYCIEDEAFKDCSGLSSISLPSSLTEIGEQSFYGCSSLTSIVIPENVRFISREAFQGCKRLSSITFPSNINQIWADAFDGTPWYANQPDGLLYIGRIAYKYKGTIPENTIIDIKEGTYTIAQEAFWGCSGLTSISLPNSLRLIESRAFQFSGLSSITIPEKVNTLGIYAFEGCSKLTYVRIPDRIFEIPTGAFQRCSELKTIIMGKNLRRIGQYAFEGTNIKKAIWLSATPVVYTPEMLAIGYHNDFYLNGAEINLVPNDSYSLKNMIVYPLLSSSFENDGIMYVPTSTTENTCDALSSIYDNSAAYMKIASTITYQGYTMTVKNLAPYLAYENKYIEQLEVDLDEALNDYAFTGCSNMRSVTIGGNVKIIGNSAFAGCSGLTSVVIPNSVTSIGNSAFDFCSSLASVVIPNSVTSIGNSAFYGCSALTSITIPSSVTSIGDYAFDGCNDLDYVMWYSDITITGLTNNNPNAMYYVTSRNSSYNNGKNVIVNSNAENLQITDGKRFYCPEQFTAKTAIYSHNYSMQSGYENCQGWETLVLPFDVTTITSSKGEELLPFAAWTAGSGKKPFWLYELTAEGWRAASAIKANTPYIISMPNNKAFDPAYNISGEVTFTGTNVQVACSDNMIVGTYGQKKLIPTFLPREGEDVYALNVSNWYVQNPDASYLPGSTFLRNSRPVKPFEAYLMVEGSAAHDAIPLFDDAETTGISDALRLMNHEEITNKNIYNLNGQRIEHPKKGLYIINGRKVLLP